MKLFDYKTFRYKKSLQAVCFFIFFPLVIWAQPAAPNNLSGEALKTWLKDNWYTGYHSYLSYNSARFNMYTSIDVINDSVYCVYTGFRMPRGTSQNLDPINAEHTVPQSFFNTNSANSSTLINTMTSDIHHLFPTHQSANSTRSNYPFAEIANNLSSSWNGVTGNNVYISQSTAPTVNIERWSQYRSSQYEPREDHKGDLARAIFYFFTMYPNSVVGGIERVGDLNTLYQWHLNDPVSTKETTRNTRIGNAQGNRNPYVVYPDLVARSFGFTVTCNTPTLQANNLNVTATSGSSIRVTYTRGNGEGTLLLVKAASDINSTPSDNIAYTPSTSFGNGSQIGSGNFVVAMGTSTTVNITGLLSGVSYFVKAFEYNCSGTSIKFLNPAVTGSFSATTTVCAAPTTQVSNLQVGSVSGSSLNLSFTGGNGSSRIILAREGSAVSSTPIDNTTYTANADFSAANSISTGQKIVYNGTGNSVTVTGLNPSSTYHFAAFEYDCATGQQKYNINLSTGNRTQATTSAPSSGALEDLIISEYIEGLSNEKYIEIFNGTGADVNLSNYQIRLFTNGASAATTTNPLSGTLANGAVKVYRNSQATLTQYEAISAMNFNGDDALAIFNISQNQIVDIFGQIGCDPGTAWIASGGFSTLDKTLRRKTSSCAGVSSNNEAGCGFPTLSTNWDVFEPTVTSGLGSHTASCAAICTAPTGSPTANIGSLTATTAQLTLTPQTAGNHLLVVLKQGASAFSAAPVNGTNYTANLDFTNASSSALSEGKVIYAGAAGSITITGLSNATSYRLNVIEFAPATACYNISNIVSQSFNTVVSTPSAIADLSGAIASATSIQLTFSAPNTTTNAKGYLLLSATNTEVSGSPLNGTAYAVGNTIGNATVVGLVTTLSETNRTISSLSNGNIYHYALVPFNSNAEIGNSSIIYGTAKTTSVVLATLSITLNSSSICQDVGGGVSSTLTATVTSTVAFPSGNEIILELSNASGSFASATEISRTSTQLTSIAINFTLPSSTVLGNGYKVRARSTQFGLISEGSNNVQVQASAQNISGFELSIGDATLTGTYTNPTTCLDEVLVVYRASSANTFLPTGNGLSYTVGQTYSNSIVAYKGLLSNFSIASLSNGTTYFVKVFTRSGTAWSAGVELSASPSNVQAGIPAAGDIIVNEIWQEGIGNVANDLFISEYMEGSSNNKMVEIYNPTNSAIDLTAGAYKLRSYINGSPSPGGTPLNLSGTIPARGVVVFANTSTNTTIRNDLSNRGVTVTYSNSSVLTYNGDDALELVKGASNTRVDLLGNTGEDPGSSWSQGGVQTVDRTIRRKPSAIDPRTANSTGFSELASYWIQEAEDFSGNFGFHKAEVNRLKMISFTTLKTLNMQGLSITDKGECLSGRLINIAGDNVYTFPTNASLAEVPAGTIVQIFWSESGTNDFNANDGLIRVFANFNTDKQISTGEQFQFYTGTATTATTCGTGSAKTHTTISAFNYGLNNWSTVNPVYQDEGVNPNNSINFGGSILRVGQSIILKSNAISLSSSLFNAIAAAPADYYEVAATKTVTTPIIPNISFPAKARVTSPDNATVSLIEGTTATLNIGANNWVGTLDGLIVVLHTSSTMGTPGGTYSCYVPNTNFTTAPSVVLSNTLSATDYCASPITGAGKVISFGTSRTIAITGLSAGTTYYYRIYGYNGVGKSLTYTAQFVSGEFQTKAPQIEVSFENEIKATGSTAALSNLVLGAVRNVSLKVKNTGTLNLVLSTLNLGAGLSLQGSIGAPLLPEEERVYTLTLNAGSQSDFSSSISITSNALNAANYLLNLTGTAKADSLSRVSLISTGYVSTIPYINHQQNSINTDSEGIPVLRFAIQDGVASGIADNVATRIGSFTFSSDKLNYIRAAALVKVGEGIIPCDVQRNTLLNTLTLTPTAVCEVANGASANFELRVSFSNEVEDEETVILSLQEIAGVSSLFSTAVLEAVISSPIQFNKIEVTATSLRFIQQPLATQGQGQANVTAQIAAVDANNKVDIGLNGCTLTISFNNTLIRSNLSNAGSFVLEGGLLNVQGIAIYESTSAIQMQVTATGFCASLGTVNSANFAVNFNRFLIAQKRLVAGTNLNNSTWESVLIGAPVAISSEGYYGTKPDGTEEEVIVNNDFEIDELLSVQQLEVSTGKTLTVKSPLFIQNRVTVNGTLTVEERLKLPTSAQLIVNAGGSIVLNNPNANTATYYDSTLWNGVESFAANSHLRVLHYPAGAILTNAISNSSINGASVCFDKVSIENTNTTFTISNNKQVANVLAVNNALAPVILSLTPIKVNLDSLILSGNSELLITNINDTLNVKVFKQTGGLLNGVSLVKAKVLVSESFSNQNGGLLNAQIQFVGTGVKEFNASNTTNINLIYKIKEGSVDLSGSVALGASDSLIIEPNTTLHLKEFDISGNGVLLFRPSSILELSAASSSGLPALRGLNTATVIKDKEMKYLFSGIANQVLDSSLPDTIASLLINKPEGKLQLTTNKRIANTLELNTGKLWLGNNNLYLGKTNQACIIPRGDDSLKAYVVSNGSGKIHLQTPQLNTTYTIPLGDSLHYSPFFIRARNGLLTANSVITASVKPEIIPFLASEAGVSNYLRRYWQVEAINYSNPEYEVSFLTELSDVVGNRNFILPVKHNASATQYGALNTAGGFDTDELMGFQLTGLTTFSDFGAGDGEAVLPVQLLYFKGSMKEQKALFHWATATEVQNAGFEIQYSVDGKQFESLQFVAGKGNSNTTQLYVSTLLNAKQGYYRLLQRDWDGKQTVYSPIYLKDSERASQNIGSIKILTNPSERIILEGAFGLEDLTCRVVNAQGKLVFSSTADGARLSQVLFEESVLYVSGVYTIQFVDMNGGVQTLRWVKK